MFARRNPHPLPLPPCDGHAENSGRQDGGCVTGKTAARVSDAAGCRGRSPADHGPPIGAPFFSSCGEGGDRSGASAEEANPLSSPRLGSITSQAPPSSLPRRQPAVASGQDEIGQDEGLSNAWCEREARREDMEAVGCWVPMYRYLGGPGTPSSALQCPPRPWILHVRLTSYSFLAARRVGIPGLSTH